MFVGKFLAGGLAQYFLSLFNNTLTLFSDIQLIPGLALKYIQSKLFLSFFDAQD